MLKSVSQSYILLIQSRVTICHNLWGTRSCLLFNSIHHNKSKEAITYESQMGYKETVTSRSSAATPARPFRASSPCDSGLSPRSKEVDTWQAPWLSHPEPLHS